MDRSVAVSRSCDIHIDAISARVLKVLSYRPPEVLFARRMIRAPLHTANATFLDRYLNPPRHKTAHEMCIAMSTNTHSPYMNICTPPHSPPPRSFLFLPLSLPSFLQRSQPHRVTHPSPLHPPHPRHLYVCTHPRTHLPTACITSPTPASPFLHARHKHVPRLSLTEARPFRGHRHPSLCDV